MPYTMVAKAKQEEMERFARMKVYEVVQKHEVDHDNSVVIGSRWVITNKGTPEKPVAKARLVAQEFADNTLRDELFTGTPNLTSVKYLLSRLCTRSHVGIQTGQGAKTPRTHTRRVVIATVAC